MDALDRLYFEFVEILRRERPSGLTDRFTVQQLHEELIPYRRVRNSAGLRSNDDYEAALSRLLAGERGYMLADGDMQIELRAGLDETLPDIRRYHAFPDARVRLDPERIPPPGDIRYAPPELREQVDWTPSAMGQEDEAAGDSAAAATSDEELADVQLEPLSESEWAAPTRGEAPVEPGAPMVGVGFEAEASPAGAAAGSPEPSDRRDSCPRCGASLPEGAVFCPFCGNRLSPETCSNCGAEMEPAWRFCAACGASRAEGQGHSA